ncbi:MAG: hypothetical protein Q9195_008962 [Heterodermia aff. obscurata]
MSKLTPKASPDLKIQELDLSRNLIEDFREIKGIVSALKSLKALRLNGNRFQILPENKDWLMVLRQVKELCLDETYLSMATIESLVEQSGLTSLSLASNNLSTPFCGSENLSLLYLNLASNEYTALKGLTGLPTIFPSLETLSLRSNPLTNLEFPQAFANVLNLDVSSTLLSNFDALLPIPSAFPRLKSLLTTNTPLQSLPASNLHTIARIRTLTSLNHSRISPQERTNAELYYLTSIASELASVSETSSSDILHHHPRYPSLCSIHGAPPLNRPPSPTSDLPKPGTLAARLTTFTFYHPLRPSFPRIQKRLPRTLGIYALKGLVGRLFALRPMSLRLVWETGEWDPVPGSLDDEDEDDDDTRDRSKWARREIELVDGTRDVGFWIEGAEAVVRVELR